MNRRAILRYTALLSGAAVISPIALTLSSCTADTMGLGSDFKASFFDESAFKTVTAMVDVILPKTNSPSATEVGVHQMIDHMVANVFTKEQKATYKSNFSQLLGHLQTASDNKGLEKLNQKQQQDLVQGLESIDDKQIGSAYKTIKQQTIAYYLSTEEVGTKFLNYLPVPGEYQGCIELSEVDGKAWAI